jgi:DNA repair protein RecN (Recombination protein N)
MLDELQLCSVGGIKRAALTFSRGLVAVTGESGAGKSSLVRGLELLSGRRSTAGTIRAGDDMAVAEAFFNVEAPLEGLEDEKLQPQDRSFCLKRELSRSGRGKCSIQGQTVPLNLLAEVAPKLISIQSQFAQFELLDEDRQLKILDACGGVKLAETKKHLGKVFADVLALERQLRDARQREQEITSSYGAVAEISPYMERLKLTPESEEALNRDYETTERELKRLRDLRSRCRMLSSAETGGIIEDLTETIEGTLQFVPDEKKEGLSEFSQQVIGELNDLLEQFQELSPAEKLDDLEAELEQLETTIGIIRKCKRLAKVSTFSELLDYWHKGEKEMAWLTEFSKVQEHLNKSVAEAKQELAKSAKELHALRVSAAETLQKRVSENLNSLAMENTQFHIQLTETNKLRANGAENVEFTLSRGNKEIPVAKAASGGELSRILLAIQISLPAEMLPPTLVFDEVEAGLGGQAAYLTGLKLKQLASRVQVILITHEASIAALADQHYLVERTGNESKVILINGERRVREIARMLSGRAEAQEALAHARKLLGASDTKK